MSITRWVSGFLRINNVPTAIREVLNDIRDTIWGPIDNVLRRLVGFVKQQFEALYLQLIGGGDPVGSIASWSGGKLWYDKRTGITGIEGSIAGAKKTLQQLPGGTKPEARAKAQEILRIAPQVMALQNSTNNAQLQRGLQQRRILDTKLGELAALLGDNECGCPESGCTVGNRRESTASRSAGNSSSSDCPCEDRVSDDDMLDKVIAIHQTLGHFLHGYIGLQRSQF